MVWNPWAGADPVVNPNLETTAIIASRMTQPLKGATLRVIYLVERVCR